MECAHSTTRLTRTHQAYWTGALNGNGTQNAFTVVAKDNGGSELAAPVQVQASVTAVNDAPIMDLNGAAPGSGNSTPYTVEDLFVLISPTGTITDVDSANMTSLSATLTTRPDGNTQESLSLNATAAAAATANSLTVTYTQSTGVLLITGSATKAIYETILNGIYIKTKNLLARTLTATGQWI